MQRLSRAPMLKNHQNWQKKLAFGKPEIATNLWIDFIQNGPLSAITMHLWGYTIIENR